MTNCLQRIYEHTLLSPQRMALWTHKSGIVTYSQFGRQIAKAQTMLGQNGFANGDTIFIYARPTVEMYAAVCGALGLGGHVLFIEPWLNHTIDILDAVQPKFALLDAVTKHFARIKRLPVIDKTTLNVADLHKYTSKTGMLIEHVAEGSPATTVFTSGSTGIAKGIVRSHGYTIALRDLLSRGDNHETISHPDLCVMNGLVLLHLATGRGSIIAGNSWSVNSLRRLNQICTKLKPSTLSCGPAFLAALNKIDGFESLKKIYVGGAPTDVSLMEASFTRWPKSEFIHIYGSTEIEPISICDARIAVERSKEQGFSQMLYLGEPISEVQHRIEDETLWVKASNLCNHVIKIENDAKLATIGAYANPLSEPQWHCTGDRVLTKDGKLYYAGRTQLEPGLFFAEQRLYRDLGHSRAFISSNPAGHNLIYGEKLPNSISLFMNHATSALPTVKARIIRDRRHRSRIDRERSIRSPNVFFRWQTYLRERSPIAMLTFIAAGPALVPQFMGATFKSVEFVISTLFIVTALATMRLYDEVKDYQKDLDAHPNRPLPRGLITLPDASAMTTILTCALLAMAAFISSMSLLAGVTAFTVSLWCHLIAHDFYAKKFLQKHLLLSTMLHQIVVIPLYSMPFALMSQLSNPFSAWFVLGALSGSLMFEFSRKMGVHNSPLETNYRVDLGLNRSIQIVAVCGCVYALALAKMGMPTMAIIMAITLLVSLMRFQNNFIKAKSLENATALCNAILLWAIPVIYSAHALLRGH